MSSHNHQRKVAVINDFSGFGRCSLTVSIPIISTMRLQCCPVPTAIFSNHTGYDSFVWQDFTETMPDYLAEWKKLDLQFEGIATGFLGSADQIEVVKGFFRQFKSAQTTVLVDPVMGDYGKLYPTYTKQLADRMAELLPFADILTPNLTEACMLTDTPYDEGMDHDTLLAICQTLSQKGPDRVVISGIPSGDQLGNFVYERGKPARFATQQKVGTSRSGTGDVFSAILLADAVHGADFFDSVCRAAAFIQKTILRSIELDLPTTDGICFEEYLTDLAAPPTPVDTTI